MVTGFDVSQEIISIDMLTALKSSLKHRRKNVLRSLQLFGRQGSTADVHQPWTNYMNNRIEYLIIGAIVYSEYSNI